MTFVVILIAGLLYGVGTCIWYSETIRNSSWFYVASLVNVVVVATLWLWLVRYLKDNSAIYTASVYWDVMGFAVCYGIPIVFFDVKPNLAFVIGTILVLSGITLIHVYGR